MNEITQVQIDGILADRAEVFREWARTLVDHSRGGAKALAQTNPGDRSVAECLSRRRTLALYIPDRQYCIEQSACVLSRGLADTWTHDSQ